MTSGWQIIRQLDGVVMEWWQQTAPLDGHAVVTLTCAEPLAEEQWHLIKRQFDNMGIVPRFAPSHDQA